MDGAMYASLPLAPGKVAGGRLTKGTDCSDTCLTYEQITRVSWKKQLLSVLLIVDKNRPERQVNHRVLSGFSGDAVEWLIGERDIAGLGTECIDVELGWKTRNAVKLQLAAANRVSLVQLANLAQLPPAGIEITVAPLKLGGGSGGPARVFAVSGVRGRNDGQRHGSPRDD